MNGGLLTTDWACHRQLHADRLVLANSTTRAILLSRHLFYPQTRFTDPFGGNVHTPNSNLYATTSASLTVSNGTASGTANTTVVAVCPCLQ